jgi:hypothetical protein
MVVIYLIDLGVFMNIMKKCLLFLGLIGIMGAIKTDDVVVTQNLTYEDRQQIANEVMNKIEQKDREKTESRAKTIITIFAFIGIYGSIIGSFVAGIKTYDFFQQVAKNAATCAANCVKNAANSDQK